MSANWRHYKNILCVRLDNMGDVLMTTPAFCALKNDNPHRKLTLLTSQRGATISPFIPEIDETIICDVPWVKNKSHAKSKEIKKLIEIIKQKKFDAAIIFTAFGQSSLPGALLLSLATIPHRLAYNRENPYKLLTDWIPDPDTTSYIRHEVVRQLDLVKAVGFITSDQKLSLFAPKTSQNHIREQLRQKKVDLNKKWILVHLGASDKKRHYPYQKLLLALKILQQREYQIVLSGSNEEKIVADKIKQHLGPYAFSFVGDLAIDQLIALVAITPLLIANNTGPVHIAAAVNTPIIDLYARTNPQHTPWMAKSTVLYFDVAKKLQTKNKLLQSFIFKGLEATPENIVKHALELVHE